MKPVKKMLEMQEESEIENISFFNTFQGFSTVAPVSLLQGVPKLNIKIPCEVT